MPRPTTKNELLNAMTEGEQELYDVLSRIPEDRMTEIALYNTWSIKDLIAHLSWWQNNAAEHIETVRQGGTPQAFEEFDTINAEVFERYRHTPLAEVRAMEARTFAAIDTLVKSIDEDELFDAARYPAANGRMLAGLAAGNTFGHYGDHLPDVREWMTQNNLV